jgi:hypothetical protein
MAKRSTKAAAGTGRKRTRKVEEADENANFFLVDEDEKNRQQESEEDEEQQETAEQKRIRLGMIKEREILKHSTDICWIAEHHQAASAAAAPATQQRIRLGV